MNGIGLQQGLRCQAAGHIGLAIVVLGHCVQAVGFVDLVVALEVQVVDSRVAVLAPVAAAYTGVPSGSRFTRTPDNGLGV